MIGFAGERGEDGTRSEVRISRGGGGYTDVGGGDHDVDPGWRRKGGESCFAVDDDVARRLGQIDGQGASRALHVVEKP